MNDVLESLKKELLDEKNQEEYIKLAIKRSGQFLTDEWHESIESILSDREKDLEKIDE